MRPLTMEEAKQLVLGRLAKRQDARSRSIEDDRTLERPFGWIFFLTAPASVRPASSETALRGPIIVNKHVAQIVATSSDLPVAQLIEIYETLLVKNQGSGGDWCSTLSLPFPWSNFRRRRLAKKAREAGFYEL